LKSGDDLVPEEIGKKLDLDQSMNFGCGLIWEQMKAKLTGRTPELFATFTKCIVRGSSRVGRERKTP
jgi:hypothetical protein